VIAVATLVGVASCGREPVQIEACPRGASASSATAAPTGPFLGMLQEPDTGVDFGRLDPRSLEPVSRLVHLGEYHDAWSLSPDGTELALGVSAPGKRERIGMVIVDLEEMKVVREIETGGAAEALAWLTPHLLVGSLVSDGTVLVDPVSGEILRRWPSLSLPEASARIPGGLVMLFRGPGRASSEGEAAAAARLAIVDVQGRLRSVALDRILLGSRVVGGVQYTDEAGLAVDPTGARAVVFAGQAPAAEVDLGTLRVSYHTLAEVEPDKPPVASFRRALWLEGNRVLVVGRDFVSSGPGASEMAAGAILVDTAAWDSCLLDAKAGGATVAGDRILVYGKGDRRATGLRTYAVEGREAFDLLRGERVWDVQATEAHAYARTPSAVYVVDLGRGRIVSTIVPPRGLLDVVAAR
jgi:hypothetical protein